MKRTLQVAALVVTVLGLAGTYAVAQTGAMSAAGLQQVSGKITSIDAQKSALQLQPPAGRPTTFTVDGQTVISKGMQRMELGKLQAGDQVQIEYAPAGGTNVARSITVQVSAGGMEKNR